jgi:hypothetical protein
MRFTRTLAGIAAGAVLAAGLALGSAAPAIAAPPSVVFPTCATMLPARDFTPGGLMSGWNRYTTPPFTTPLYGASNASIITMIQRYPMRTCTWTPGTKLGAAASISEVTLSAADLKALRKYYVTIGVVGVSHGGPALSYTFAAPGHPTWIERHTVFPNGTVVFTLDRSGSINGAMSQDADDVLIGLNPWINV